MTTTGSSSGSSPGSPPEAWRPLRRLAQLAGRPIERFLRIQAASGIVLLIAAAIALSWANSPWGSAYVSLWESSVGIRLGAFAFERSLRWVVNDGLMVIFFFVVGLEIRREVYNGELSQLRRAALPAFAALGGMIAPALIYLALAGAPQTRAGWGVPMATDIAFAVGVLALLGKRVPPALRVLLLALAVIDDLGAIIVIAIFYSTGVEPIGFAIAGGGLAGILALRALGVRNKAVYVPPAVVIWAGTYAAGIHPTIGGVVVGLVTPVRAWLGAPGFVRDAQTAIDQMHTQAPTASAHTVAGTLRDVDLARREALSPAETLIEMLHPWVAFLIMPVFALANAGVALGGMSLDEPAVRAGLGVAIGLLVGKPVGVLVFAELSLRLGLATVPAGIGRRELVVLGTVAGIGFTMALFVGELAFSDPALLAAAKVGILVASAVAAAGGLLLGRLLLKPVPSSKGEPSGQEARIA